MKINLKFYKTSLSIFALAFLFACSEDFLDVNTNPNVASEGELGLLLTSAQVNIGGEFSTGLGFGGSVYARQLYGLGASTYAITGATYQADWNGLYSGGLKDLREIEKAANEQDLAGFEGIAKVLEGYTFHQLVDYFGDIPYAEALDGENNFAPAFQDDASIYDAILEDLDAAIVLLDTAASRGEILDGDIMYGGNFANWVAAANTLKLKMLLNISNVDAGRAATGINAILTDGRIIDTAAEDWQVDFTTTQVPDNRHQLYNSEYDQGPGYLDNHLMLEMVSDSDPRLRYYFYRQATYGDLDFQTTPCSGRSDCATWDALFATGTKYIGRDHGDPSGLPGDDNLVTVPGLYPIGGKYDNSTYSAVNQNGSAAVNGAQGAGFMPLFTSSWTHFMLAEAALNVTGVTTPLTASGHFQAGMQDAFDKVRDYAEGTSESDFISAFESANSIDYDGIVSTYITGAVSTFDGAASAGDQLELVMRQKARAQYGNGMESYTDLRRTGRPNNYPASLAPAAPFPLRVLYPDTEIASNPSAPEEVVQQSTPIFWDN